MGKKIGIDSVIFIYLFEQNEQYLSKARQIFNSVKQGKYEAVFSVVGMIEILTGPKKAGRLELAYRYKELIKDIPNLTVYGINENVIELSSELRAVYGLNTPDAIHVATAIDFGADKFITNDKRLSKIKEIKIELL